MYYTCTLIPPLSFFPLFFVYLFLSFSLFPSLSFYLFPFLSSLSLSFHPSLSLSLSHYPSPSLSLSLPLPFSIEIISRYPMSDNAEFPLPVSVPLFCLPFGVSVQAWNRRTPFPLPTFSTFALTNALGRCVID